MILIQTSTSPRHSEQLGKLEEVLARRVAKYAARGFKIAVTPQDEERLLALVEARKGAGVGAGAGAAAGKAAKGVKV